MAREDNFLLGYGERLTDQVKRYQGSGPKSPPYNFSSARNRVTTRLVTTNLELGALPQDACPGDQAVAVVTMHPRYISKSDFPTELLGAVGLHPIGGRTRSIVPDQWGIKDPPQCAVTDDIFVAGTRDAFLAWERELPHWTEGSRGARQLLHFETISAFLADEKVRSVPTDRDELLLEVVLHNARSPEIIEAFEAYAVQLGACPLMHRQRDVGGLTFLPVQAPVLMVPELAKFAFARVLRGMPSLRPCRPTIIRNVDEFPVELPDADAIDPSLRVAIFDGGLPDEVDLSRWVKLIEPDGIGPAVRAFQEHGLAVTSAFLFGPLIRGTPLSRPFCNVDHVRVLDRRIGWNQDLEYIDVLDRIIAFLDKHQDKYQFVSLSIGPNLAVADDEITVWTASLDQHFARGTAVASVAAGNDGHLDSKSGLNRVQPPADGVNVLSVGATDTVAEIWKRAEYSCVGPGRSPGFAKPDGVTFGGSSLEPFMVLAATEPLRAVGVEGTSFSAPYTLRAIVSARTLIGDVIKPLTLRALMNHRAERGVYSLTEVGWGRFDTRYETLITCDDDQAIIIFQGELPVGELLRAPIPMPAGALDGKITITATLMIAPEIDPEYPGAYTQSGLDATFRPNAEKFHTYPTGKKSRYANTKSFFGRASGATAEYEARTDGYKWEPCRRNSLVLAAADLKDPVFDIYHHYREGGSKPSDQSPIPYALVVGLKAPQVPDFYNRIVRTYATLLVPLRPQIGIPIRV